MPQNQKPLFDNWMHKLARASKLVRAEQDTPAPDAEGLRPIESGSTARQERKRYASKKLSLEDLLKQLVLAQATDLARAGRYAEAERLLAENVRDQEMMPATLDLRARICAQQRRFQQAHVLWTHALQLDPKNDAYIAGLLRLRQYMSSRERARNHIVGGGHDYLVYRLVLLLGPYIEAHSLGMITLSQAGYEVPLPSAHDTVWVPDLAFVQANRVPAENSPEWNRPWKLAPDLVVEVVAPDQSHDEADQRAYGWLERGVRLVWMIWSVSKTVDVWRLPGTARPVTTLGVDETLDGLDVIPGFTCPLTHIFSSAGKSTL